MQFAASLLERRRTVDVSRIAFHTPSPSFIHFTMRAIGNVSVLTPFKEYLSRNAKHREPNARARHTRWRAKKKVNKNASMHVETASTAKLIRELCTSETIVAYIFERGDRVCRATSKHESLKVYNYAKDIYYARASISVKV